MALVIRYSEFVELVKVELYSRLFWNQSSLLASVLLYSILPFLRAYCLYSINTRSESLFVELEKVRSLVSFSLSIFFSFQKGLQYFSFSSNLHWKRTKERKRAMMTFFCLLFYNENYHRTDGWVCWFFERRGESFKIFRFLLSG